MSNFPPFNSIIPFTANGTSNNRNLSTRFADTLNLKDFGAAGDGITDDSTAVANWIANGASIRSNSNGSKYIKLYAPASNYLIGNTTAIPPIKFLNLTIEGDGAEQTTFTLANNFSNALFTTAEIWYANGNLTYRREGMHFSKFSIYGNTSASGVQHGINLSDRNDMVYMNDIYFQYIPGSALRIGADLLTTSESYTRESDFYGLKAWYCGTNTYPAIIISSTANSSSPSSNELKFYGVDIFASGNIGLLVNAPNNTVNQTKFIQFHGLRVEDSGGTNIQLGSNTDNGLITAIEIYGMESINPGNYALAIDSNTTSTNPFNISIYGTINADVNKGILINACGGNIFLDIGNMNSTGNNFTVGPASGRFSGPIFLSPRCEFYYWTTNIDPTTVSYIQSSPILNLGNGSNSFTLGSNNQLLTSNGTLSYWSSNINVNSVTSNTLITIGNSTINSTINSTMLIIGNTSVNTTINSSTIDINGFSINSSSVLTLANLSSLGFGNSTVNTYINSTYSFLGNSTFNTIVNSTGVFSPSLSFGDSFDYSISFQNSGSYGRFDANSDYNMYFQMYPLSKNRGFVFRGQGGNTAIFTQIDGSGNFYTIGNGYFMNSTSVISIGNSTVNTIINSSSFSSSSTANGNSYIPGGLIHNWGWVSANSTVGAVTFSKAYVTNAFSVIATSNATGTYAAAVTAWTNTGATILTGNATSTNVYYYAIGS